MNSNELERLRRELKYFQDEIGNLEDRLWELEQEESRLIKLIRKEEDKSKKVANEFEAKYGVEFCDSAIIKDGKVIGYAIERKTEYWQDQDGYIYIKKPLDVKVDRLFAINTHIINKGVLVIL